MNRTAVVTGSASGIGRAVTDALLARGDRVIGVDLRNADVLADLSTTSGRAEAVAGVLAAANGPVDVVVACAGISGTSPAVVSVKIGRDTSALQSLMRIS